MNVTVACFCCWASKVWKKIGFYRHIRKVGSNTQDCWWDMRLKTRDPSHRLDTGPKIRKFSQFSLNPGDYE